MTTPLQLLAALVVEWLDVVQPQHQDGRLDILFEIIPPKCLCK